MTDQQHPDTLLTHKGRPDASAGAPVNPPLVRASTLLFADVAEMQASHGSRHSYGRHSNPPGLALEQALCSLEGAAGCRLTPSGLSAITTTLLALLRPGDHLLMTDSAYEPTRSFCHGLLAQLGISTTFYDPLLGAGIETLVQPNTRLIFAESPGSLTFEVQDIPALSAVARRHDLYLVADNTWATPLGWRPFELGIDVSIHAATKYIVGHSDVMLGAILCNERTRPAIERCWRGLGLAVSSDDAYLGLRGLRTLGVRLGQHAQSALQIAQWLSAQPQVAQVLYPPLPGSPGHELWQRDYEASRACGLLGVLLPEGCSEAAMHRVVDACRLFGRGYSWGGFESLIIPVNPAPQRSVTASRWQGRHLLRLHIGLEDSRDLMADLQQALAQLKDAP
ncbi:cystathionine beta-lyase [Pseudomonas fluvialis]|uniref:Cystathionine beta-lyase n=1 Tax=Pseudomonas fluvialis TaxID=1793966 RepID=A0A7X0BYJ8_9PSED|nr:cystathionine beta-lyase [Pseudomonas fluvialis]MBB6343409.1 cystathionine beta-lyase [Pseudomonas fluvialis]